MTIENRRPLLQIADQPDVERLEIEPEPPNLDGMITTGGSPDDRQYVLNNARPDDYSRWKAELEKRRANLPKVIFLKCTKCGFRTRQPYRDQLEKGPVPCLQCNRGQDKKGGLLKEMSKGEIDQWEKDKAADNIRRDKQNREMKEARRIAALVDMAKRDPR